MIRILKWLKIRPVYIEFIDKNGFRQMIFCFCRYKYSISGKLLIKYKGNWYQTR